jgi:acetyltransferase-like isoleucine patch superfamily enzyme
MSQEKLLSNLRINFPWRRDPKTLTGIELNLSSLAGIVIDLSSPQQTLTMGKNCAGRWNFAMHGACSSVTIGDDCTANDAQCMLNAGCHLVVGSDCMFAQVYIHVGDNHAIFDLGSMAPLNVQARTETRIGNHVWLASRCTVLSNLSIGEGSIIAACSVVTKSIPRCSLAGGTPARVLRSNVSWTRSEFGEGREAVAQALQSSSSPPADRDTGAG